MIRTITLAVGLALAAPVSATITYTLDPSPCSGFGFRSPTDFDSLPCGSISGMFTIEDGYVPGTFADISTHPGEGLDYRLVFRVLPLGLPSSGIFDFQPGGQRMLGSQGSIRMPELSGFAVINLGTPATSVRGGQLDVFDFPRDTPYRDIRYTINDAVWTLQTPRHIPEPGTLALLLIALVGYRIARIKV